MCLVNLFDKCKGCGCLSLECNYCFENSFYRHIDDKTKMKKNLEVVRFHRSGYLQYYRFFYE